MSEQGPERRDQSGVDFTSAVAAAKASGEAAMMSNIAACEAVPGVGAPLGGADVTMTPNYGSALSPDLAGTPVHAVGEGYQATAPVAPAQTDHARPQYADAAAGDEDRFLGQP